MDDLAQVRQEPVVGRVGQRQDEPARREERVRGLAGAGGREQVRVELALGRVHRHEPPAGQGVDLAHLPVQLGALGDV